MGKKGGYSGGMGGMNMNNIMKQAQKMQKQMEEAQSELEQAEYTVTAGGGMVEVVITGSRELKSVKIDPEAVDPDDVEMLEDLITAAVNEAIRKVDAASQAKMANVTGMGGGLNLTL